MCGTGVVEGMVIGLVIGAVAGAGTTAARGGSGRDIAIAAGIGAGVGAVTGGAAGAVGGGGAGAGTGAGTGGTFGGTTTAGVTYAGSSIGSGSTTAATQGIFQGGAGVLGSHVSSQALLAAGMSTVSAANAVSEGQQQDRIARAKYAAELQAYKITQESSRRTNMDQQRRLMKDYHLQQGFQTDQQFALALKQAQYQGKMVAAHSGSSVMAGSNIYFQQRRAGLLEAGREMNSINTNRDILAYNTTSASLDSYWQKHARDNRARPGIGPNSAVPSLLAGSLTTSAGDIWEANSKGAFDTPGSQRKKVVKSTSGNKVSSGIHNNSIKGARLAYG